MQRCDWMLLGYLTPVEVRARHRRRNVPCLEARICDTITIYVKQSCEYGKEQQETVALHSPTESHDGSREIQEMDIAWFRIKKKQRKLLTGMGREGGGRMSCHGKSDAAPDWSGVGCLAPPWMNSKRCLYVGRPLLYIHYLLVSRVVT
jgi:hypothetical protein